MGAFRTCEKNPYWTSGTDEEGCENSPISFQARLEAVAQWESCMIGDGRCFDKMFPLRIQVDPHVQSTIRVVSVTWVNVLSQSWAIISACMAIIFFLFPSNLRVPLFFRYGALKHRYTNWIE